MESLDNSTDKDIAAQLKS